MSFTGDIGDVNITGTNVSPTATSTIDFSGSDVDTTTWTTGDVPVWGPSEPTKEFLEMWKWLRTKLLKELLSDDPKGIQFVNITQIHEPSKLPEYKLEMKFFPIKIESNLRDFDKPEVKNRSPARRGFRT